MARPKKPKYGWIASRGEYRHRITDAQGRRIAIYAPTVEELEEKIAVAQQQIDEDLSVRKHPTVTQYCERWMKLKAAHVSSATMRNYAAQIRKYIIAQIGGLKMSDVTLDDLDLVCSSAARMSSSVYRSVHMLIKCIFRQAQRSGVIVRDPSLELDPRGGRPPAEKQALSDQQVRVLLDAVRNTDVYPFVMLGLYAGLRREEILGLQWDCVHIDGPTPRILVRRAWRIEHNRPIVDERLKTKASRRTIPIPPMLVDCLASLSRRGDYVITRGTGALTGTQWRALWNQVAVRSTQERKYVRYRNGKKEIHVVRPQLGAEAAHNPGVYYTIDFAVTPHQLRHTYVTNLLLAGVDVKTVQHLAGHENSKITLDIYAHLTYNQPEDLIGKVCRAFDGAPE